MNKKIEEIIAKYFDEKISREEVKELVSWIEKGNKDIFNEYVYLNFSADQIKVVSNKDASWKTIASKIDNKKPVNVFLNYKSGIFKYAAAVLVLVSIGLLFLNKKKTTDNQQIIVNNDIQIGTDKATLTLEDGTNIALEKGQNYEADNLISNGEELIYNNMSPQTEIAYNYLTIPRGGQFYVELSDGTKVWLNSDTKIKYPKEFRGGQDREVELEYGEAFFEVTPGALHGGAKFNVHTGDQKLEVLGTEFNVKAYKNESAIYITLVEGSVLVNNSINSLKLIPNQQSVITVGSNQIAVNTVNVDNEISWKNGIFNFEGISLKELMKLLERWYDVDVVFEDKALEEIKFNGIFRKNQPIENILLSIKNTNIVNEYELVNKKIILK